MTLLPALILALAPTAAPTELAIRPSQADARIKAFDEPNQVIVPEGLPASAPLFVFLPGTGGQPAFTLPLLRFAAGQGYRAIGLQYNNLPAVVQLCTDDPDPACAGDYREMRIEGTGRSHAVHNAPEEAIVARLVALLRHLDRIQPGAGWGGYLDGDQPRWDRLVIGGQSQGAGMAAWIAKRHRVRRVYLFSSPWETTGKDARPAPWLYERSATPIERWAAAYNAREKTANLLKPAYAALGLPEAQINVLTLDLLPGTDPNGPNPYHGMGIRDPRYADVWRRMFGRGDDPVR